MFVLYLLLFIVSFAVCSDQQQVVSSNSVPSMPPQDIRGRHCRKVSAAFCQKPSCLKEINPSNAPLAQNTSYLQEVKDSLLKASQGDSEADSIFPMDE